MVGGDVSAGGVALHAQGRGDGQHSLMLADIPGSKEREATPEGKQGRRHQEAGREGMIEERQRDRERGREGGRE